MKNVYVKREEFHSMDRRSGRQTSLPKLFRWRSPSRVLRSLTLVSYDMDTCKSFNKYETHFYWHKEKIFCDCDQEDIRKVYIQRIFITLMQSVSSSRRETRPRTDSAFIWFINVLLSYHGRTVRLQRMSDVKGICSSLRLIVTSSTISSIQSASSCVKINDLLTKFHRSDSFRMLCHVTWSLRIIMKKCQDTRILKHSKTWE